MPELVNDWDDKTKRPVVRYGVRCTRCTNSKLSEDSAVPEDWKETLKDGRIQTTCPDCGK